MDYIQKTFEINDIHIDEETREFTFVGSTPQVDRDGDIVLREAFDLTKIQKTPIHYFHKELVGHTFWAKYPDQELIFGGKIDKGYPEAERAYQQVRQGSLPYASIGFKGLKWERNKETGGRIYKAIDLGEVSLCSYPSNPGAKIKSYEYEMIKKAFDIIQDEQIRKEYKEIINEYDFKELNQRIDKLEKIDFIKELENLNKRIKEFDKVNNIETKFNQLNELVNQILSKEKQKEHKEKKEIETMAKDLISLTKEIRNLKNKQR